MYFPLIYSTSLLGFIAPSILFLFIIFLFFVWIGAIIDIIRSEFQDNNEKIIWILLVIFLPFIGTILYIAIGNRNKIV